MPPRIGPKRPVRVYLAQHREKAGLTQQQLGERIDPIVDKGTVSRWEAAKPGHLTLGVIAAFAEALGKHPTEMYRPPQDGPSLDALAAPLEPRDREVAADLITRLARQRAS
jgi:transcriptional regulator with XRE-family HTH domain